MVEPEAVTQSSGTHVYPCECQHWHADRDHAWQTVHVHAREQRLNTDWDPNSKLD